MNKLLSLLLLGLAAQLPYAFASSNAHAQTPFIRVVPDTAIRFIGDNDTTIMVLVGVGSYDKDSVFHADQDTHLLRVEPPFNIFRLESPTRDTFVGIDTLLLSFSRYLTQWDEDLNLWIDGRARVAHLSARGYNYEWLTMTSIGSYTSLEIDEQRCFDYYELRNPNGLPVTITRMEFRTADALTVSPIDVPHVLQPNDRLTYRVCAKAPLSPDTLTGELEVDLAAGQALRDTIRRSVTVYVVPLYLDHCLRTNVLEVGPIYPWDGQFDTTIYLENRLITPITITAIRAASPDSNLFSLTGHIPPFTIPGGSIDSLHLAVRIPNGDPTSNPSGRWNIDLTGRDSNGLDCPSTYVQVYGNTINYERSQFDLAAPSTQTVQFSSFGQKVYRLLTLRNSGTGTYLVRGISLNGINATAFSIEHSGLQIDSEFRPGDSALVYLSFPSSDLPFGEYQGVLSIDYDNGTATVPLHGSLFSIGVASQPRSSEPAVSVWPNPTQSEFHIDIPAGCHVDVSILDVLGREIASVSNVRASSISSNSFGAKLRPGAYIVRVAGIDTDGRSFVASRKVSIRD